MIRLLPLALAAALASPALAETDCKALWGAVAAQLPKDVKLSGRPANPQDGFCVLTGVELSFEPAQKTGLAIDRLLVKGSALDWLLGTAEAPQGLEGRIEGLRVLVRSGYASYDYAMAAQARLARTNASFLIRWDAGAKALRLERLNVDLPGNNAIALSAEATGVDLSSPGAIQASAAGFALTRLDLDATLHGAFEYYLLPVLATTLLPADGDAEAAAKRLKIEAKLVIDSLPEPTFPAPSRDAAKRVVDEMPNPSGRLTLAFRADPGFGPVRLARYAMTGLPRTLAEAAPLFQGVVLDLGWTHEDAE